MKKVGIALIVIELVVIVLGFVSGKSVILKFFNSNEPGMLLIPELIGYLLPGIIGIILYNKGSKREQAQSSEGAGIKVAPTGNACPSCGAKAEAGDAFCVNCGAKLMR